MTSAWLDKKAKKNCLMVTSKGTAEVLHQQNRRQEAVFKPKIVDSYNKSMGDCDHMDQMVSFHGIFKRKNTNCGKGIFTGLWRSRKSMHLFCINLPGIQLLSLRL